MVFACTVWGPLLVDRTGLSSLARAPGSRRCLSTPRALRRVPVLACPPGLLRVYNAVGIRTTPGGCAPALRFPVEAYPGITLRFSFAHTRMTRPNSRASFTRPDPPVYSSQDYDPIIFPRVCMVSFAGCVTVQSPYQFCRASAELGAARPSEAGSALLFTSS